MRSVAGMSKYGIPSLYQGCMLGLVIIVAIQVVGRLTHAFFGVLLLFVGIFKYTPLLDWLIWDLQHLHIVLWEC